MKTQKNTGKTPLVRRILLITSVLLLLGAAMLMAVSCSASIASPETLFEEAVEKTFEKVAEWDIPKMLLSAMNGGSVKVTYEDEDAGENIFKLYTDVQNNRYYLDVDMKDTELLNDPLTAGVYLDQNKLVVNSQELLGGAYGVDFKNAVDEMKNSVFAPDSNSDYEMDPFVYYQIVAYLEIMNSDAFDSEKVQKLREKARDCFMTSIKNNATFTKEDETVEVLGEDIDAVLVTVSMDDEIIINAVKETWDMLKNDPTFKDLLESSIYLKPIGNQGIVDEDIYGIYDQEEPDDEVNETDRMIEEIEDAINDLEETLNGCSLTLKLYFNNRQSTLMRVDIKVSVEVDDTREKAYVYIELGNTLSSFEGLKITANATEDGKYVNDPVVIEVKVTDTDSRYKLTITTENFDDLDCTLKYSKSSGAFDLYISYKDSYKSYEYTASGIYTEKSGTHTFTLEEYQKTTVFNNSIFGIENTEERTYWSDRNGKLIIEICEKDRMPSAPKYTDFLTIKESDLKDILETVEDMFD